MLNFAGEIAKLQIELQDTKELMEKTEFEGREEIEKLKMEIRCLKERIVTQERQLTAYEVAQKVCSNILVESSFELLMLQTNFYTAVTSNLQGDPQVVQEIQKMAAVESEFQKEVARLEQENMHLRLQIEQLQLEAPRLRDRVQNLQKYLIINLIKKFFYSIYLLLSIYILLCRIVDALKIDKTLPGQKQSSTRSNKPLGELERTITALKQVIEKLQTENKKLKTRTDMGGGSSITKTASTERLRVQLPRNQEKPVCIYL